MAEERVLVITGASSGIGRATAHAFATRGCALVLAARSEGSLGEVVRECEALGGRAVAVPADISDEADAERILEAAIDHFGHVDVWVNNAAVMAYGRFEEVPADVHHRVVETNLIGSMRCARVAVRHFRRRGRGRLINVGSLYGKMTSPYVSAYVTSKFGLLGFNEVLRQELADDPDISTSIVLPASVDTPIFRHTANYTGKKVRPVPPVSSPQRVVRAIVRCAERPRREVTVGRVGRLLSWGHAILPTLYDRLAPLVMDVAGLVDEQGEQGPGNVFQPTPEWNQVDGDWRRASTAVAPGVFAVAAAGLAAYIRRRARQGRTARAPGIARPRGALRGRD